MKRCMMLVALMCTIGLTSPILFEVTQSDSITVPAGGFSETDTVLSLSFSLDTTCYAQLNVGQQGYSYDSWLELNGEKLFPTLIGFGCNSISYVISIKPGSNNLILVSKTHTAQKAVIRLSYLQALVFCPDKQNNISENIPRTPTNTPMSKFTRGSISMNNAKEVIDITGKVIPNVISKDRVYFNSLPQGIYYVKTNSVVIKVVKL